jgi:hypothetical protein
MGQKMLIMATLKKYGNWIMEYLYKSLYLNVNGWSTHKVEIDDYGFTIIDLKNVGHKDEPCVLAATIAQVFYILDPKDEKKYIVVPRKQWVVGGDNVEDKEEYNKCDEVPFFVDTRRINIIETKISYINVIPYTRTDGEGKLVNV